MHSQIRNCFTLQHLQTETATLTFDVGMDLGSPVALDYHEKAPFEFNGNIHKIHIKYTDTEEPEMKRISFY